jgi:hypothetical protein
MPLKTAALALALCAALPAAAVSLQINDNGTGQALYLPYYTVEDGQATLVSISNNTPSSKAVRVTYSEALNGQHVLFFNLYLRAWDSWSAALVADGADGARLVTQDGSCLVPDGIRRSGASLLGFDYTHNFPDDGPQGLARTRSGAIEIVEMGTTSLAVANSSCEALEQRFAHPGGLWLDDPNADLLPPSGGLSATAHIVAVETGTVFTLPATAIDGFSAVPHHREPGTGLRFWLPIAGPNGYTVDAGGDTLQYPASRGPDAMTALFATRTARGDVHLEADLSASTDWIIAFPTKAGYVSTQPGSLRTGASAVPPFARVFGGGGACDPVLGRAWDAEGVAAAERSLPLCAQTQRLSFSRVDTAPELFVVPFEKGRAELQFGPEPIPGGLNHAALRVRGGLPVVAHRISTYVNGQLAAGLLANYSEAERLQQEPPRPH